MNELFCIRRGERGSSAGDVLQVKELSFTDVSNRGIEGESRVELLMTEEREMVWPSMAGRMIVI